MTLTAGKAAKRGVPASLTGYGEEVLEIGQQEAFETSEIEGTAEVRGRRATVVWTASGLVGDAELSRRLERAHGAKLTSATEFLRALRMIDASGHVGCSRVPSSSDAAGKSGSVVPAGGPADCNKGSS